MTGRRGDGDRVGDYALCVALLLSHLLGNSVDPVGDLLVNNLPSFATSNGLTINKT